MAYSESSDKVRNTKEYFENRFKDIKQKYIQDRAEMSDEDDYGNSTASESKRKKYQPSRKSSTTNCCYPTTKRKFLNSFEDPLASRSCRGKTTHRLLINRHLNKKKRKDKVDESHDILDQVRSLTPSSDSNKSCCFEEECSCTNNMVLPNSILRTIECHYPSADKFRNQPVADNFRRRRTPRRKEHPKLLRRTFSETRKIEKICPDMIEEAFLKTVEAEKIRTKSCDPRLRKMYNSSRDVRELRNSLGMEALEYDIKKKSASSSCSENSDKKLYRSNNYLLSKKRKSYRYSNIDKDGNGMKTKKKKKGNKCCPKCHARHRTCEVNYYSTSDNLFNEGDKRNGKRSNTSTHLQIPSRDAVYSSKGKLEDFLKKYSRNCREHKLTTERRSKKIQRNKPVKIPKRNNATDKSLNYCYIKNKSGPTCHQCYKNLSVQKYRSKESFSSESQVCYDSEQNADDNIRRDSSNSRSSVKSDEGHDRSDSDTYVIDRREGEEPEDQEDCFDQCKVNCDKINRKRTHDCRSKHTHKAIAACQNHRRHPRDLRLVQNPYSVEELFEELPSDTTEEANRHQWEKKIANLYPSDDQVPTGVCKSLHPRRAMGNASLNRRFNGIDHSGSRDSSPDVNLSESLGLPTSCKQCEAFKTCRSKQKIRGKGANCWKRYSGELERSKDLKRCCENIRNLHLAKETTGGVKQGASKGPQKRSTKVLASKSRVDSYKPRYNTRNDSSCKQSFHKMLINPLKGELGPPLVLYKCSSNIDCRVKGNLAVGFRYEVTHAQRFVSPTYRPNGNID